jgi:hypothetical protein
MKVNGKTMQIMDKFFYQQNINLLAEELLNAIKSAWHRLRKILTNSFRWFLSSFINCINTTNRFVCQHF